MTPATLTRRQFVFGSGAALLASPFALRAQTRLTAHDIVERIKLRVGIPWNGATYRDTFKAGDPDTPVAGIASTFMTTFDVIQRSKAAGLNFIVTHEPTFWSDADEIDPVRTDPLYREKLAFVERSGMVIWRFHDHWHARTPDGIFAGWNKALGWEGYVSPDNARRYSIPPTTLGALAEHVASALQSRSVRVIGNPALAVRTVARGAHTLVGNLAAVPGADAVIISEAREWDSIEYARDTVLSGQAKGFIVIAHEAGEEAGMDECARWLQSFVPEVPVTFVPTGDLLWVPENA